MPTYTFRCSMCGDYDLTRPMAESDSPAPCPACAANGRRVFGSPALQGLDPALRRALDASTQSSDAPTIVSSVPGHSRAAFPTSADPRHARLPRP